MYDDYFRSYQISAKNFQKAYKITGGWKYCTFDKFNMFYHQLQL